MSILIYLPSLEVLFFNLFTIDKCCRRKYPAVKTAAVLLVFSVVLFSIFYTFSEELAFFGDGTLSLLGFVYLIPMRYVYKEKIPFLFIVLCTCWVYTLGILALAFEISAVFAPDSIFAVLLAENLLFLGTLIPFYRWLVPKYIFVIENLQRFDKSWYKYIALNNSMSFLMLEALNRVFRREAGTVSRILVLLLILTVIYVSYYILYTIVVDAVKMGQLEKNVLMDSLTKAGNRAKLWEDLHQFLKKDQSFSMLFMDLDRFKQINDRYGHMIGDQYLKHFAEVVSRILSDHGQLYRFGGDEFVAVCTGIVPQEIVEEIQKCREWDDHAPCPFNQVSVGVLFCQPPHQDAEQILQQVDRLMYQQKMDKKRAVQA